MCYPAASWRVSDKCRKGGFMVRIKRFLIAVTLIVALAVPSCAFAATETGTTTDPVGIDSPVGGDGVVIASSTGKEYNGKKPHFYVYKILANGSVEREEKILDVVDVGTHPYKAFGKDMTYTITKAPGNKITTAVSSKSYSYKKLKKRSYSFTIKAKASKGGSVTYKSSSKYVSVSKSGKVTVKKRAKKGTYKVAVTVTNKNYKTVVKYITVRVK